MAKLAEVNLNLCSFLKTKRLQLLHMKTGSVCIGFVGSGLTGKTYFHTYIRHRVVARPWFSTADM